MAVLLRTFETLLPTVPIAVIAATEMSPTINVYSIAVAPSLSLISLRKMDSIAGMTFCKPPKLATAGALGTIGRLGAGVGHYFPNFNHSLR